MRNNGDVVSGRHGSHAEQLGHAAEPHHVRLDDIQVPALDQLAEPVAGVLVLARGELDGGVGALDLLEPVRVVRRKTLLPPVDVEVLGLLDDLNRVRHIQRHVAVHHQRKVRTDGLAVLAEELNVLLQADVSFLRAVRQRHLGTPETRLLGGRRVGTGAVEVETFLGGTTNHLVDGLVADLAEEIPKGEVYDRDDGDGETLAAVEHGGTVHLLEEVVGVSGVSTDEEAFKVLVNEPACWRTCLRSR